MICTAKTIWNYKNDMVILTFKNYITGEEFTREYKTRRSAKIAETKFFNNINRQS